MICDRCGLVVATTPADPLCWTSLGRHHYACMRAAWTDHAQAEGVRQAASTARRSAAMKARWAGEAPAGPGQEPPLPVNTAGSTLVLPA